MALQEALQEAPQPAPARRQWHARLARCYVYFFRCLLDALESPSTHYICTYVFIICTYVFIIYVHVHTPLSHLSRAGSRWPSRRPSSRSLPAGPAAPAAAQAAPTAPRPTPASPRVPAPPPAADASARCTAHLHADSGFQGLGVKGLNPKTLKPLAMPPPGAPRTCTGGRVSKTLPPWVSCARLPCGCAVATILLSRLHPIAWTARPPLPLHWPLPPLLPSPNPTSQHPLYPSHRRPSPRGCLPPYSHVGAHPCPPTASAHHCSNAAAAAAR
jgi:hypothetical protein